MTEFDTMSDKEEVIDVLHQSLESAIKEIVSHLAEAPQQAQSALLAKLSDMRGMFEGAFRSR
jgi:hypothetical protein